MLPKLNQKFFPKQQAPVPFGSCSFYALLDYVSPSVNQGPRSLRVFPMSDAKAEYVFIPKKTSSIEKPLTGVEPYMIEKGSAAFTMKCFNPLKFGPALEHFVGKLIICHGVYQDAFQNITKPEEDIMLSLFCSYITEATKFNFHDLVNSIPLELRGINPSRDICVEPGNYPTDDFPKHLLLCTIHDSNSLINAELEFVPERTLIYIPYQKKPTDANSYFNVVGGDAQLASIANEQKIVKNAVFTLTQDGVSYRVYAILYHMDMFMVKWNDFGGYLSNFLRGYLYGTINRRIAATFTQNVNDIPQVFPYFKYMPDIKSTIIDAGRVITYETALSFIKAKLLHDDPIGNCTDGFVISLDANAISILEDHEPSITSGMIQIVFIVNVIKNWKGKDKLTHRDQIHVKHICSDETLLVKHLMDARYNNPKAELKVALFLVANDPNNKTINEIVSETRVPGVQRSKRMKHEPDTDDL